MKNGVSSRRCHININGIPTIVSSTLMMGAGSLQIPNPNILQIQASGNPVPVIWRNDSESGFNISGTSSSFAVVYITRY